MTIGIQDGRIPSFHPDDEDLRILGLPILYHPRLSARHYYTRVHVNGGAGGGHGPGG